MFKKAQLEDLDLIEAIAKGAISSLRENKIDQWNNGYPNRQVFLEDIQKERGFLYKDMAYVALIFDSDPNYQKIDGAWHYDQKYVALHRTMVLKASQGLGRELFLASEKYISAQGYNYLRIDTHQSNFIMLGLLKKLGYRYCGEITLAYDHSLRQAFDKLIV